VGNWLLILCVIKKFVFLLTKKEGAKNSLSYFLLKVLYHPIPDTHQQKDLFNF